MCYKVNEKVFGSRKLTNCPICSSGNIQQMFRIPYREMEEYLPYRGCHLKYVSTYDYEAIYCWDVCDDCQTLFMNPIEPFPHDTISDDAVKIAKTDYQMESYRYRANEVLPFIKGSDTLLEVGCGGGQVLNLMRDEIKFKRVIGVEVNHTTVAYLKEQGFEAYCRPFEQGLPEAQNGTVDCVLMHEVIEHLDSPYQCFSIIAKLLKRGGVFSTSAQNQGDKLFFRPSENVCTNLDALTMVFQRLGMTIVYNKYNSGKIRVIGEKI